MKAEQKSNFNTRFYIFQVTTGLFHTLESLKSHGIYWWSLGESESHYITQVHRLSPWSVESTLQTESMEFTRVSDLRFQK